MSVNIGLDGFQRSKAEDENISKTVQSCFKTAAGKQVLKYLRSITIEMVNGPGVDANDLYHMEGQRYLVGLLERRMNHAGKAK